MPTRREQQTSGVPTVSVQMLSQPVRFPWWYRLWHLSMWIATGLFVLIAIGGQVLISSPVFNVSTSITSIALSPDGKNVLTIVSYESLKLLDLASGDMVRSFGDTPSNIGFSKAFFSPDGQYILTSDGRLWEVVTGKLYKSLQLPTDNGYFHAAFSPDSKSVVITTNQSVKLWDTASGREIRVYCCFTYSDNRVVDYSTDGKSILIGGWSTLPQLLDVSTGKVLYRLGTSEVIINLAYSPDGKNVVTVEISGSVKVWDTTTGEIQRTFEMGSGYWLDATFSPDGKYMLYVGANKPPQLWDIDTGTTLPVPIMLGWTTNTRGIDATFTHNGKSVLSLMDDGTAILWDIRTGNATRTFGSPDLSRFRRTYLNSLQGNSFLATLLLAVTLAILGLAIRYSSRHHKWWNMVGWKYMLPWISITLAGMIAFYVSVLIVLSYLVI